jgi:hypothetical protein
MFLYMEHPRWRVNHKYVKKTSSGDFLDLGTFLVREYAVQFPAEDFDCGNRNNEELV